MKKKFVNKYNENDLLKEKVIFKKKIKWLTSIFFSNRYYYDIFILKTDRAILSTI